MRIFIIHNFYQHQGGEDVVFNNEVDLLSSKHEIKTYTTKNLKSWNGLRQFISYAWNRSIANEIVKEIQAFQPDVVHLHNIHYAIGPYLIRKIKKAGFPLLMTLHNYRLICPSATLFHKGALFTDSLNQNFPWTAVRKKVLDDSFIKTLYTAWIYYFHRKIGTFQSVDRYILLSQFAKDKFEKSKVNIPQHKLVVKPNFVPDPAIQLAVEQTYFIYIGRLSEEKGIVPLLQNLAGTEFRLKVFGSGPQLEIVRSIIDKHPNLEYGGYLTRKELLEQLAGAAALIVPSVCYEGMPMTILDAFALGRPVVASNIGILAEMVVPLYTGNLYDPFQQNTIRETLAEYCLLDPMKKEEMSKNCRAEFIKKYTADINISLLESIYNQAVLSSKT